MASRIVVLGDPEVAQLRNIRDFMKSRDTRVDHVGLSDMGKYSQTMTTAGYISFVPVHQRNKLETFLGRLPVDRAGDCVLFQQAVQKEDIDALAGIPVSGFFHSPITTVDLHTMCRVMGISNEESVHKRSLFGEVVKYREENRKLITIATALSSVNSFGNLLNLILTETRKAVTADAASIYLRPQRVPGGEFTDRLQFEITQNDSVKVDEQIRTTTIPISDDHIAGYVAKTGTSLNIEDVNAISGDRQFKWGREVTTRLGYPMKSMLTIALKNLEGEVVGVLQLMNKKRNEQIVLDSEEKARDQVIAFSHSDEEFISSIGSLVAASIERAYLYKNIHDIFEGFLNASSEAIDARDRVTAGHSKRVARYAMAFAEKINGTQQGTFADVRFDEKRMRQFKFASLLHDYGKIGVPEAILTKRTRLSDEKMEAIRWRGAYIKSRVRAGTDDSAQAWKTTQEVEEDLSHIVYCNSLGYLEDQALARVREICGKEFTDESGVPRSLLTPEEADNLLVQRGNLTPREREVINSHAESTRRILSRIAWSRDLRDIPTIAAHHHEKMDGSGYPDGIDGSGMRLEERILAVIDIFEALVSQDRPYKAKMTPEEGMQVLEQLVKENKVDAEVVDFFREQNIYRVLHTA